MSRVATLPFVLKRSTDVIGTEITSTRETVHGLLRLEGDRLTVQWRTERSTDRVGMEIRTDREVDDVREVVVPLGAVSGAYVRRGWWGRRDCVLVAADLGAFDIVAGAGALKLDHPAELVVRVRRADRLLAEEFVAELAMAVAESFRGAALESRAPRGSLSGGSSNSP